MEFVIQAAPEIGRALVTTIELSAAAFGVALVLGTLAALCRVSPVPVLRGVGAVYVETVRNVPLLVILVFFVFGLPDVGITFPLFACMILGMGIYSGTYVCEAVRSGILSLPRGEIEAARSLGLRVPQIMGMIILPTAFRNMIQPLAIVLISTILSTSLAASLGVNELTAVATKIQDRSAQLLTTFLIVGAGYMVLTFSVGLGASRWQRALTGMPRSR
jgi:glutamate transport system permease protein